MLTCCSVQQIFRIGKVVDNQIINVLYCTAGSTNCSWSSVNGHTRSRFITLVGMLEPLDQVIITMRANGKCLTLDAILNLISSGSGIDVGKDTVRVTDDLVVKRPHYIRAAGRSGRHLRRIPVVSIEPTISLRVNNHVITHKVSYDIVGLRSEVSMVCEE